MFPTIHWNDRVVINLAKVHAKPDAIIVSHNDQKFVIHRIVQIRNTTAGPLITIKGDNNTRIDGEVSQKQVIGSVDFAFPSKKHPLDLALRVYMDLLEYWHRIKLHAYDCLYPRNYLNSAGAAFLEYFGSVSDIFRMKHIEKEMGKPWGLRRPAIRFGLHSKKLLVPDLVDRWMAKGDTSKLRSFVIERYISAAKQLLSYRDHLLQVIESNGNAPRISVSPSSQFLKHDLDIEQRAGELADRALQRWNSAIESIYLASYPCLEHVFRLYILLRESLSWNQRGRITSSIYALLEPSKDSFAKLQVVVVPSTHLVDYEEPWLLHILHRSTVRIHGRPTFSLPKASRFALFRSFEWFPHTGKFMYDSVSVETPPSETYSAFWQWLGIWSVYDSFAKGKTVLPVFTTDVVHAVGGSEPSISSRVSEILEQYRKDCLSNRRRISAETIRDMRSVMDVLAKRPVESRKPFWQWGPAN